MLRGALLALTLAAFLIRVLRLEWQPLWWDEGYSVYFATEPWARMLSLTAQDIHPPLYYTLLHHWMLLLGSARPAVVRLLSVYSGVVAVPLLGVLAYAMSRRAYGAWLAAAYLTISPLHVYYSQEVRMYSLALTIGIASVYVLHRWVKAVEEARPSCAFLIAYVVLAASMLHTLYYAGFLVLAQIALAIWRFRKRRSAWLILIVAVLAILLLCLPWWLYTAPKLGAYVSSKVQSDQDQPLGLIAYALRHALAFTSGHVILEGQIARILSYVGLLAALPALALSLPKGAALRFLPHRDDPQRGPDLTAPRAPASLPATAGKREDGGFPITQLWALLLIPFSLAFLVNLRFPFFPDGGERLLLFVLPYFLLLAAIGAAAAPARSASWIALASPLFITSALGLAGYFTVPRYADDDYRPIIAQVMRQGSEHDAVLALFPWQVGYWRSYSPHVGASLVGAPSLVDGLLSPQPEPVGQEALVWNETLQKRIDAALNQGTLWFPAPVSFGSTLPGQIEDYLAREALNLDNRWYGAATRLTAWVAPVPNLSLSPVSARFLSDSSQLVLEAAGIGGDVATSDNSVIAVGLHWSPIADPESWHVTVRLRDDHGRDWAARDYERPGSLGISGLTALGAASSLPATVGAKADALGLLIPAGTPPGDYRVMAGAVHKGLLPWPPSSNGNALDASPVEMAEIAQIRVEAPQTPVSPHRLPLDHPARGPRQTAPVEILGASGPATGKPHLSGTYVSFLLALRSTAPILDDYTLSVNLIAHNSGGIRRFGNSRWGGSVAAEWQGWSLLGYPTSVWRPGALALAPIDLYLPATLPAGRYSITARLIDGAGQSQPEQQITSIIVEARTPHFERLEPGMLLPEPVQFGTHALLYGYDLRTDGDHLELALYWEALQTLLPPHHVFVHVAGPSGDIVAQHDGPPQSPEGPAPTGSWRPGEFITTLHQITLPDGEGDAAPIADYVLRVGLYEPVSGTPLPTFVAGHPSGDSVEIDVHPR